MEDRLSTLSMRGNLVWSIVATVSIVMLRSIDAALICIADNNDHDDDDHDDDDDDDDNDDDDDHCLQRRTWSYRSAAT